MTVDFIFLGCAERAAQVSDVLGIPKWNVLGLRKEFPSIIYPMGLAGYSFGFALKPSSIEDGLDVRVRDSNGVEVVRIYGGQNAVPATSASASEGQASFQSLVRIHPEGWSTIFTTIEGNETVIVKPGYYTVIKLNRDGSELELGKLQFILVNPPPMTPDRIAALKADPASLKFVRMELACKFCKTAMQVYAGLERNMKLERKGCKWYQAIQDQFECSCKKTVMPLGIIRSNLHGLLGQRTRPSGALDFIPLYEHSNLEALRKSFSQLLGESPSEEVLQKFIEKNPILLHQFPSYRLFVKPPILTKYRADFAIVTPQRELLLIELEPSKTKIMTKGGGMSSKLTHAHDQIQDWLRTVDDHRSAFLRELGVDEKDVATVGGVVIAGRDEGYDALKLRRLKGISWPRAKLLTYDDILFSLDSLIRGLFAL